MSVRRLLAVTNELSADLINAMRSAVAEGMRTVSDELGAERAEQLEAEILRLAAVYYRINTSATMVAISG